MSQINTNAILDASGGTTTSINGYTPTASNMAGRNRIINGAFDIWQRGTSFSGSGYTADRWVATAGNVSRQSFSLGSNPTGLESPYYLNWSASSAANNEFLQRVEFVTTLQNQKATLSFWAKSSTGTETFGWAIYQNFGSGGSALTAAGGGTYTPTTSWQKYTFTVDMPSLSGKTIGTNDFVWARLAQLTTNNSVSLDITGVQLEAGSVATPFERRQYGQELALCQRYFEKSFEIDTPPTNGPNTTSFFTLNGLFFTTVSHNNTWRSSHRFAVPKRATPAMGTYGNSQGYWYSHITGWAANNRTIIPDSTGFRPRQQASGSVIDVHGHWTADAEL